MRKRQLSAAALSLCVLATGALGCNATGSVGPTFELVDVSPQEFCEKLRSLSRGWVSWRYLGQDDSYHYAAGYFRTEVMRVEVAEIESEDIVEAMVEHSRRYHERLKTHPNEMALQSGFGNEGFETWKNSVLLDERLREEATLIYEAESERTGR